MLRPSRAWLAFVLVTLAVLTRAQCVAIMANAVLTVEQAWDNPLTLELDDLDGLLCLAAVYGDVMRDSRRDIANGFAPAGVVASVDAAPVCTTSRSSDPTRGPPLRSSSAVVTA